MRIVELDYESKCGQNIWHFKKFESLKEIRKGGLASTIKPRLRFQLRCLFSERTSIHRYIINPLANFLGIARLLISSLSIFLLFFFPRDNCHWKKIKQNFSFQSRDFFPKFRTAVYDRHDIVTVLSNSLSLSLALSLSLPFSPPFSRVSLSLLHSLIIRLRRITLEHRFFNIERCCLNCDESCDCKRIS